jgi:hypothetical protein
LLLTAKFVQKPPTEARNLLWAFGTLIGNSDMHSGNLSFVSEHGRPYDIAPAYDMTPMTFAPRSGGGLPDTISEAKHSRQCDQRNLAVRGGTGTRVPRPGHRGNRIQPPIWTVHSPL